MSEVRRKQPPDECSNQAVDHFHPLRSGEAAKPNEELQAEKQRAAEQRAAARHVPEQQAEVLSGRTQCHNDTHNGRSRGGLISRWKRKPFGPVNTQRCWRCIWWLNSYTACSSSPGARSKLPTSIAFVLYRIPLRLSPLMALTETIRSTLNLICTLPPPYPKFESRSGSNSMPILSHGLQEVDSLTPNPKPNPTPPPSLHSWYQT